MNPSIIDDELFAEFCRHLSASINVIDVLYKLRQLVPGFNLRQDDPVVLTVIDPELVVFLKDFNYQEFLQSCVGSLRIEKNCYDVFLSEVEEGAFGIFVDGFVQLAPDVIVEAVGNGFVLHSAALIADLILPVVSRVHQEVLHTLSHFVAMLKAVDNDPKRLFLNAKSPTPESQFIQLWVALKLKIPMAPNSGMIAVI